MKKLLLISLTLLLVLVGCSSKSDKNTAQPGDTSSSDKPVTVNMMMMTGPESEMFKKLGAMYTKEHPNVTIKIIENGRNDYFTRLKNQLLSKSPNIDIASFSNDVLGLYAASGVLENLDSYVKNPDLSGAFKTDVFVPSAVQAVTFEKGIYGIPFNTSTIELFYRTDLIKTPPTTWEEFEKVAGQFTKSMNPDSPTQYGASVFGLRGDISMTATFLSVAKAYGGGFVTDTGDVQVNSPGTVKALDFYSKLVKSKVVPPDATSYSYGEALQAFQQGKVSMAIEWDAASGDMADQTKSPKIFDKFNAAVIPGAVQADGSVKSFPFVQNWLNAINKFSKNKEEAYKFLAFVSQPENFSQVLDASNTTALKDVLESDVFKKDDVTKPAYLESLNNGAPFLASAYTDQTNNNVNFAISKAIAGEATPQQALDEVAAQLKQISGK